MDSDSEGDEESEPEEEDEGPSRQRNQKKAATGEFEHCFRSIQSTQCLYVCHIIFEGSLCSNIPNSCCQDVLSF